MCCVIMEHSPSVSISMLNHKNNNIIIEVLTALPSLPDDILHIIRKDLDFASTIALRSACRQLYLVFPDSLLFSEITLSTLTQRQFNSLVNHLLLTNKTKYIRSLTFSQAQVDEHAIISALEHFKNLQKLHILACKQVKLLPITNAMVKWHQDKSGNSPDLKKLKKVIMTRCIGGKRHSLTIKKVNEDLRRLKHVESLDNLNPNLNYNSISRKMNLILNSTELNVNDTNDGIFEFVSCQFDTCEDCTTSCANCKAKYKYWDECWVKCGWCKGRNFCGKCVIEAPKRNTYQNYAFQFIKIRLCHKFDLPCPFD